MQKEWTTSTKTEKVGNQVTTMAGKETTMTATKEMTRISNRTKYEVRNTGYTPTHIMEAKQKGLTVN